ncbi:OmpA family protein [Fulvivirga sp. M361]|uniref:OmpA family protein n=1 Tax=Fulvivirga sp. M361 TaxID=2594266 RepID=UPI001179A1D3|nr:OmpA family protein [Fulvivirga sp. M361]TRX55953.1 OmpA family protein [Fulvivirga sp. M361]
MKYFYTFCIVVYSSFCLAQEFNGRYRLVNLGRKVNTGHHEAAPVVSADGKTLYFFVSNHPDNTYGKDGSQDIWYSKLDETGHWGPAQHLGKPLNNSKANQVFTVMPDGNTLLIRGGSGKNSAGFSFTHRNGDKWSSPEEIKVADFKKMNQGKFYGATMSSTGDFMILYFNEKEKSTFSDLYMTKKLGDGSWSRPVKLGGAINTGRDEFAPYLAPDDKTMYFASNRKENSIGQMDIWKTIRQDDTWLNWSDPINVGRPLNTRAFDSYMSVDTHGNIFTTQSGNTIDGGNLDIFQLEERPVTITLKGLVTDRKTNDGIGARMLVSHEGKVMDTVIVENGIGTYAMKLPEEGSYSFALTSEGHHPTEGDLSIVNVINDTVLLKDFKMEPVKRNAILSGTVFDAKTNEPISARVEVTFNTDNQRVYRKRVEEGYYEMELSKKGWFGISATAEGYINGNDSINYGNDGQTLLSKDIYLNIIEVGTTVRLNNIFFDFDKTTLKSESFVELDKVVEFLTNNSSVEIEIAGHTDSKGSDDYNLNLSQGRAEAVVNYLIQNGVDDYRLEARGYGETVPLETNSTDEGRAVNRRVEFTVLKK